MVMVVEVAAALALTIAVKVVVEVVIDQRVIEHINRQLGVV